MAATPGAVIALGGAGADGRGDAADDDAVPLLAGRDLVDGRPAAYVCRNFTCRLPVTSAEDLLAVLGR